MKKLDVNCLYHKGGDLDWTKRFLAPLDFDLRTYIGLWKKFSFLTLISVTKHSFRLFRSFCLIGGKDSLKCMENPPWLMFFLGDQLLTLKFQTGRQTVVELCVVMKSNKDTFTKSWAASTFKFEWQNLMTDYLLGPDLFLCHQILVVLGLSGYW